ncbi:MAG: tellurite resistance TerB family protein [Silicimonas sp.]|nr:tellurite resistance TerB family protein [Silicimonas sp.]
MSLMKTLAKVAIWVAVAKGAKSVLSGRRGTASDGGLFGGAHSPSSRSSTGLEDIMSDVLSGGSGPKESSMGGLGGLLEGLQRENPHTQDGGIDDLLSGRGGKTADGLGSLIENLTGGKAGGAGGLGGLLGGLMTAASSGRGGDFGSILNGSIQNHGEPEVQPSQEQEAVAGLMLKAMIQAAKSDGKFDQAEQAKLIDQLGDISAEERDFVQAEMRAPVDIHDLAHQVPQGLERQVYAMSLMGIDLDNRQEAQYLHDLAQEFRMDKDAVDRIHAKMGVPSIYR